MIRFTVHGTPAPAGSKRGFVNKHSGRVIITDANARSRPWKAQIADAAAQAADGAELLQGPLLLDLTFWVARPKSHLGAKGNVLPSAPPMPTTRPDLLKLARAVEDSLTGVIYRDDAQIVSETLQKAYTSAGSRLDVGVVPVQIAPFKTAAPAESHLRPRLEIAEKRPGTVEHAVEQLDLDDETETFGVWMAKQPT